MSNATTDVPPQRQKSVARLIAPLFIGCIIGLAAGIYFASIYYTPRPIRCVRSQTPAFVLLATGVLTNVLERDAETGSYPIPNELRSLGVSAVNKSEGMVFFSFATLPPDACEYIVYLPNSYFDCEKWMKEEGNPLLYECRVFDSHWCYLVCY